MFGATIMFYQQFGKEGNWIGVLATMEMNEPQIRIFIFALKALCANKVFYICTYGNYGYKQI